MKRLFAHRLPLLAIMAASLAFAGASTGGAAHAQVRPAFVPPCNMAHPKPCLRFTPAPIYWSSAASPAVHKLLILPSDAVNPIVFRWLKGNGNIVGPAVNFPATESQILIKWNGTKMVSVQGLVPATAAHMAPALARGVSGKITGSGDFKAYQWGGGSITAAGPPTLRTGFRFSMK